MENEEKKNKTRNLYRLYVGMYTVLLAGFLLYILPMTRGQKPCSTSDSSSVTNMVEQVEDDYDMEDGDLDDDASDGGIQKASIGLADIDLSQKKSYPSDEELAQLVLSNDVKSAEIIDEFLRDIAFDEKWKEMSRACEVLNSTPGWQTNVSEEVQNSFLFALKDFRPVSIPEVIPFLGSPHEDITEMAQSEILDYLDESEDENTVATLIMKLSSVVNDEDFADSLILKVELMEPEIAALAMIGIIRNGTETMKTALNENMEFITDQPEMTEEAVLNWAVSKSDDGDDADDD